MITTKDDRACTYHHIFFQPYLECLSILKSKLNGTFFLMHEIALALLFKERFVESINDNAILPWSEQMTTSTEEEGGRSASNRAMKSAFGMDCVNGINGVERQWQSRYFVRSSAITVSRRCELEGRAVW